MTNHVNPDRDSFRTFRDYPRSGVVQMLNLVKFRAKALYEDGRKASGKEAYAAYGRETGPIFRALGGRIVWSGSPEVMLIGPDSGEEWDIAFIAEYPSVDAFVEMIRNPDYQEAAKHRTAAVENSRLVRMEPLPAGEGFG